MAVPQTLVASAERNLVNQICARPELVIQTLESVEGKVLALKSLVMISWAVHSQEDASITPGHVSPLPNVRRVSVM